MDAIVYVLVDNGSPFLGGGRVGAPGATGRLTLCDADKMPPFGKLCLTCALAVGCKTYLAAFALFVTSCLVTEVTGWFSFPCAASKTDTVDFFPR